MMCAAFLHYTFSAMTTQKQWSQVTMDWNLWNCELKQIFLSLNWFSQAFCHSGAKLTNTMTL
jgi:hypothetical protein